jgi:hypothetical protein
VSYRGRLIWPFKAVLAPLDLTATEASADHIFGDTGERVELPEEQWITVQAQVETGGSGANMEGGRQRIRPNGDDPVVEMRLVLHFEELEDLGLVDANGKSLIPPRHRLARILTIDDELVREYPGPNAADALFCVEGQTGEDASFGLSGGRRNLLLLSYSTRDDSTTRVS